MNPPLAALEKNKACSLRLTSYRGYTGQKLEENMDAEIMQVILEEARASYDEEIVIELTSDTSEDIDSNVERIETWIANWKQDHAEDGSD